MTFIGPHRRSSFLLATNQDIISSCSRYRRWVFLFCSFFLSFHLFFLMMFCLRGRHDDRSINADHYRLTVTTLIDRLLFHSIRSTLPPPPPLSNHPAQVVFRGPAIITWRLSLILVPERKKKVVNTFGGLWLVVDGPPTNQGRWFEAQLRVLLAPLPKRSNWKSDSMETISCVLN